MEDTVKITYDMVIKTATEESLTTMRKNKTHLVITQRNMVVINTANSV